MLATRVGYAGGRHPRPTYHDFGDHREAVEVSYDPRRISYRELLDVFWGGQPVDVPPGPNRRADLGILPVGEHQSAQAEASKARGVKVYVVLVR